MAETMVKKQLESSDIRTGACRFCGQIYQFETDGAATEEQLDRWAEEKCDCIDAKVERRKREKGEKAKKDLKELLGEKYEDTYEILAQGIDMIIRYKAQKITVDTGKNGKVSVSETAKGGIKVEVSQTVKKSREV